MLKIHEPKNVHTMELPDNTCCTVLLSDIMLNTSSNPDACIEDPTDPKKTHSMKPALSTDDI